METISPTATSTTVPLDQLQSQALAQEPDLDGLVRPFWGWFLFFCGFLDVVSSAFGMPLLSGTILSATEFQSVEYTGIAVVFFQVVFILVGVGLLSQTPWRLWIAEIAEDARSRSAVPPTAATSQRWWTEFLPSSSPNVDGSRGWMLMITISLFVIVTLMVGAVSLTALSLVLCLILLLAFLSRVTMLGSIFGRLLADQASLSGALVAVAVHLCVFLFWTVPQNHFAPFLSTAWSGAPLVWFRLYELFFLTLFAGWLYLLSGAKLNNNLVLFVTAPGMKERVVYDLSSMVKFAGRRVTANLDMVLMRDVIVLKRLRSGDFLTVSPNQLLWLSEDPHIVFYIPALHSLGSRFPLIDRCGIFLAEGEILSQPRGLTQQDIGMTIPQSSIESLIGLLNSDALESELQRVSQETFDDFTGEIQEMGERFDVRFAQLEGKVDDVIFEVETGMSLPAPVPQATQQALTTGLSELSRKQTALDLLMALREEGNQLMERWLDVLSVKTSVRESIGRKFETRFGSRFLQGNQYAVQFFSQLGISLNVFLSPDPGQSGRGEQMVTRLNERCRDVRDKVVEQINGTQQQLLNVYLETLKLTNDREKLALQNLFSMLPQLFPYFRNRPEHLMRFIEFAMRQVQGPITFEKVQQLLSTSSGGQPNP